LEIAVKHQARSITCAPLASLRREASSNGRGACQDQGQLCRTDGVASLSHCSFVATATTSTRALSASCTPRFLPSIYCSASRKNLVTVKYGGCRKCVANRSGTKNSTSWRLRRTVMRRPQHSWRSAHFWQKHSRISTTVVAAEQCHVMCVCGVLVT
jgi:hypothetical protein